MKKVVLFTALVGLSLTLGACSSGDSSAKSSDNSAKTEKTAEKSSSKVDDGKITRKQFDDIKIGDLMSQATDGATVDELKQQFGEPKSTSSSTTQGIKTDILTWTNVEGGFGANVIVSFTDNHAFGKNITGFKFNRDKKISLDDFNSLADGTSYSDVVSKFGEPDGYNETLIGDQKTVITSYMSGVKGDLGANFNVTFTNDKVSGKSQSGMK